MSITSSTLTITVTGLPDACGDVEVMEEEIFIVMSVSQKLFIKLMVCSYAQFV